ncbi:hypothetical protein M4I21_11845 [Cellulophaga sp. 20_2_10]|uniref:exo-rhamnogalacturonan lyase family protein n=1 Tax=Cellulophaga sp. 20_2_10 TaxID=2942476 RepID=UPI00201A687F|nr:hypothetical protein [Cellulophaga sp. 20_2_10]MCL5246507.1 hypothetical protein [Cellulophaga sp. 20_2_10]
MRNKIFLLLVLAITVGCTAAVSKQVPIKIENNKKGAPITLGIPFPKGELFSIDNVRLLNSKGKEIVCQTTEVTSWKPADDSIKWIWVFFFADENTNYTLEYGDGIYAMEPEDRIVSVNNMRPQGGITVNTGALQFNINKKGHGFLDEVYIDRNNDKKFSDNELIASAPEDSRGTFLDILDDSGIDLSKATVNEVFREVGSGPLHAIFRVEGTYKYNKEDNNDSPFSMRIHTYAGKKYIKVLHTLTYTGVPDKHKIQKGEHSNIATQKDFIVSEDTADDKGWTQPNDQISGCGLTFKYHLDKEVQFATSTNQDRDLNTDKEFDLYTAEVSNQKMGVLQTGPRQNKKSEKSTPTQREVGFNATIFKGKKEEAKAQRAKGWVDVSDASKGISVGIKNFLQEYPKELEIDPKTNTVNAYVWPSSIDAMSFERKNTKLDGGMLGNFAQGITKTTEFIYYFHTAEKIENIELTMDYVLDPPIAHANPEWYTASKVYGKMAPYSTKYPEFENALQYKYDWMAFNQEWESWYSIFDYGDIKTYYFKDEWHMWTNNEPTVDFSLWTNFMRTGNPKYYHMAQGMSKHTMDVDNIHWPRKRTYVGEINDAIDFWNYEGEPESTPYLGIGRRHGDEHWSALLSAHVWIQGWIASYYITGDQRALEVAKMTGDTYLNRIWGDHDLRGRRLYLSILNLVELYDATKLEKYKVELDDRVKILLELQKEQGGNLLLDRYGYSQTYVAQGLYKYYQLTGSKEVKKALVDHARWVKNIPPLNHKMESYLATIYPLVIGYDLSGNKSFLNEAKKRAEMLKVSKLPLNIDKNTTQKEYNEAMLKISRLPKDEGKIAIWDLNQGLRVFGWTHANNIPYLLYWLDNPEDVTSN